MEIMTGNNCKWTSQTDYSWAAVKSHIDIWALACVAIVDIGLHHKWIMIINYSWATAQREPQHCKCVGHNMTVKWVTFQTETDCGRHIPSSYLLLVCPANVTLHESLMPSDWFYGYYMLSPHWILAAVKRAASPIVVAQAHGHMCGWIQCKTCG